jgi:hypothetical protein
MVAAGAEGGGAGTAATAGAGGGAACFKISNSSLCRRIDSALRSNAFAAPRHPSRAASPAFVLIVHSSVDDAKDPAIFRSCSSALRMVATPLGSKPVGRHFS